MPTQGRPSRHAAAAAITRGGEPATRDLTAATTTPDGELARLGLATAAAIAALLACRAATAAENFACTLAPSSMFSQTTDLSLPLAGTWIGNFDAAANPTGTKTIPGLFGGSGNNPIPFSGTLKPQLTITDAHPAGTFGLSIDASAGTAAIS